MRPDSVAVNVQYSTNSLPLASFLCCNKEITFVGINKSNPASITFLFEPVEKAQEAADQYFGGQAQVVAIRLFQEYRTLKDLLFEAKRNSEAQFRT